MGRTPDRSAGPLIEEEIQFDDRTSDGDPTVTGALRRIGDYLRCKAASVVQQVLQVRNYPTGFNDVDLTGVSDGYVLSYEDSSKTIKAVDAASPLSDVDPVNVTKAASSEGTATEASRQDHKHDVTTAIAGATTPGDSAAEGSATSLARSDHQHSIAAFGSGANTFCEGDDSRLSDDRTADGLRTATTVVSISGAAAPTSGQVLKATSGTNATWQNEAGGGQVIYDAVVATSGGDYTSVYAAFNAGHNSVYVKTGTYVETSNIILPTDGCILHGDDGAVITLSGSVKISLTGSTATETAGTIGVVTDDATVTGSGTSFTNLSAGDYIKIKDTWVEIGSITDDTSLELIAAWRGDTFSGESWMGRSMAQGLSLKRLIINGGNIPPMAIKACVGFTIEDVRFRASGGNGLTLEHSYSGHLEQVSSSHMVGSGLFIVDCYEVTVDGSCHFDNNNAQGIRVDGNSRNIRIANCSTVSNGSNGVHVEGTTERVTLEGVFSAYNDGGGLQSESSAKFVTATACTFRENDGVGVDFDGTDNILDSCVVDSNYGSSGVTGGTRLKISNCQISNNAGQGILQGSGDSDLIITGNRIYDNTGDGVQVAGDKNVIGDNAIFDNGNYGINITSAADITYISNNRISGHAVKSITNSGTNTYLDVAAIGLPVQGDVLYHNGTNWTRLAAGTSGHFLKTNGAAANPAWAAVTVNYPTYILSSGWGHELTSNYGASITKTCLKSFRHNTDCYRYDGDLKEGYVWDIKVPTGATNIIFDFFHGVANAQSGAKQVAFSFLFREYTDDAARGSWSSIIHLQTLDIPASSTNWHLETITKSLSTLGMTAGRHCTIILARDPTHADDDMVEDWILRDCVVIGFS